MKEMLNVHAAKTNFSKLLARVAKGEEIVIAKGGTPVARLVPYAAGSSERPLGILAGKVWMSDDAIETPAWLLDAFEGIGGEHAPPAATASSAPPPGAAPPVRPARVAEVARGSSSRRRKR